jgi:hypothetical protein
MIDICTISLTDFDPLCVNEKEVMRYLHTEKMDDGLKDIYTSCVKKVYEVSSPRAVFKRLDISVSESTVDFGFMKVSSKSLAKNLSGCQEAFIFAATLGIGVDRAYERIVRASQANATVFSAVASSFIESFCDYVNEKLAKDLVTRPRFSVGYGDFLLEHQKDILSFLEADKRLGLCLTKSYMMVPVKSVTAIIGIRS